MAVANLAQKKVEYSIKIVREGGVDELKRLIKSDVSQVQQAALGAVGNMIREPQNAQLVASHEQLLVSLGWVLNASKEPKTQQIAANVIANFASHAEIRATLREERIHVALLKAAETIEDPAQLGPVARGIACMALDQETQVLIAQVVASKRYSNCCVCRMNKSRSSPSWGSSTPAATRRTWTQ